VPDSHASRRPQHLHSLPGHRNGDLRTRRHAARGDLPLVSGHRPLHAAGTRARRGHRRLV
ncbi:MAG: hypothetical protein AVDCRST_MAG69-335, partial [uncultured Solirubrobacteraceae bacterium]